MLAALDEGDTADMYVNVIQSQAESVKARREGVRTREMLVLDSAAALALEESLFSKMKADPNLREHVQSVRYAASNRYIVDRETDVSRDCCSGM